MDAGPCNQPEPQHLHRSAGLIASFIRLEMDPTLAQQPRITTTLVTRTEDVIDLFFTSYQDRKIDDQEAFDITSQLQSLYQISLDTDAGFQIGIAFLRGGAESQQAHRHLNERRHDPQVRNLDSNDLAAD